MFIENSEYAFTSLLESAYPQIREEVEAEYGLKEGGGGGLFSGKAGLMRAVGILVLIAGAITAGRFSNRIPGFGGSGGSDAAQAAAKDKAAAPGAPAAPQDIDKMLAKVGDKAGPDAASTGDEAADEESLLKASRNGGPDAKGIPIDQALASANALAKSVGNTTAERALAGGAGAPGAGKAGAGGSSSAEPAAPLPAAIKLALTSEFAVSLAQLGQAARAKELVRALQGKPELASDPALAKLVRHADLEVQSWALNGLNPGLARQQVTTLQGEIPKLSDPSERAVAYARTSTILSKHAALPRDATNAFLLLGGEAIKTVPGADQRAVLAQWTVAMSESLLAELSDSARQGKWTRAQALHTRLREAVAQASTPDAAARLQGLEFRARHIMGMQDKADAALDSGLLWVDKSGGLTEQATALRALITASQQPGHAKFQDALARLQTKAEAAKGAERARALAVLALTYADAGQQGKFAQLRDLVLSSSGLSSSEATSAGAQLLVRGDLALALARQSEGSYAEVESLLQRVAGYIL